MKRIGIFAGSFDPIHEGHITFALEAIKKAKLAKVYFLPEAKPRYKTGTTHFAHRVAMIKIAAKPHKKLAILELPDRQYSVVKTLPRLNQKFKDDELFLLIGSDVVEHLSTWALINSLLERMSLIVGLRNGAQIKRINQLLPRKDKSLMIDSSAASVSSQSIRQKLLAGKTSQNLDPAVKAYIKTNWLYASPSNSSSDS